MRRRQRVSLALVTAALWSGTASAQQTPTFARDIAPVVFDHCARCHRPGGGAPFSLLTYDDVRRRASVIAQATRDRIMPPWKPEPGFGHFDADRRLTDDQVALFERWAKGGTPRGDVASLPTAPQWPGGWQLGTPDLVVTLPDPYALPADGSDVFRTFVIPLSVDRRRYVKGLEFQPGVVGVVHHASLKTDVTRASRQLDDEQPGPGYDGGGARTARFPDGQFLAWTPGQAAEMLPEGMGWRLDPDTDLVLELHLVPDGKAERVNPTVGFYFTDTPPTQLSYIVRLGSQTIDIPAGEREYKVSDSFVLPIDADVFAVQPHAHNLAKEIKTFARLPDGSTEWLLYIKQWDFRWQEVYRLSPRLMLPKGTTVEMEFTYDNSADNPRNPNRPPARVTYGQTTASEMGNVWLQLIPKGSADLVALDRAFLPKLLKDDIAGYEKSIEMNTADPRLRADLAFLLFDVGRGDEALTQLNQAVQLAPESAVAHYALGTVLLSQRKLDEARAQFEDALRIRPSFSEAHGNLGVVYFAEGRYDEAIAASERALGADPRNVQARYNLGRLRAAQGRPAEAADEYRRALEVKPLDADMWSSLAVALASAGQVEEAVTAYRRAIAINPDAPAALVDLAWILSTTDRPGLGTPEEAVRLAEHAAALTSRRNPLILDTLGVAYFAAGHVEEALRTGRLALDQAIGGSGAANDELIKAIQAHLMLFSRP